MSQVTISYKALENAADEADKAAKRMDDYSDQVNDKIYRKLLNYKGAQVDGLSTAKTNARAKRDALTERATDYRTYATDLRQLSTTCESVDKQVQKNVARMSSSFCKQHDISISVMDKVGMAISNTLNGTVVGRYINSYLDFRSESKSELNDQIRHWFRFGGGAQFGDAVLTGLFGVGLCVFTVLTLPVSAPAIVCAAAAVGAGILIANTMVNIAGEFAAYNMVAGGDPVAAYRTEAINSTQDMLRLSDDKNAHLFAGVLDATNTVCSLISMGYGAGKLLKNGYKWATGITGDITDVSYLDMGKEIFAKLKENARISLLHFDISMRYKDFASIGAGMLSFGKDFAGNLGSSFKNSFLNFSSLDDSLKSGKAISKVFNSLCNDGPLGMGKELLKIIPILTIPTAPTERPDFITSNDMFMKPISSICKIPKLFSGNGLMDMDVLSAIADFTFELPYIAIPHISTPDIHVPNIHMPDIHMPDISMPDIHISTFSTPQPNLS